MTVHRHPTADRAPPAAAPRCGTRLNPHVFTFGQVCEQLGILAQGGRRTGTAWRLGYLIAAIESQGFPPPLPRYCHRQRAMIGGRAAVHPHASWQRVAVDAWFEGHLPPGANAAAAARTADEDSLDANAANLDALVARRHA